MLIDIHVHTSNYSSCGKASLEEMISEAKRKKLDAIFITDHESRGAENEVAVLALKYDIIVEVGYEHLSKEGDIVVLGVKEMPDCQMSAQELIDFVHKRGGLAIAAHPYRNNNRGLGDKMTLVQSLDGIEGYNGNTSWQNNQRAVTVAKQLNIPVLGGSDAHNKQQLGCYATHINVDKYSWTSFKEAVQSGQVKAVQWDFTTESYQIIN